MITLFKQLLGNDPRNKQIVDSKRKEAHHIKNAMANDVLRIKRRLDTINSRTNTKLNQISDELESVTYKIAVASGGKKRGL